MTKDVITFNTSIKASKNQVSCDLSGESAILNISEGIYYGLGGVGSTIWKMLDKPTTLQKIYDTVLSEYEVSPEQCQKDLLGITHKLFQKGLIEITNAN